ncbi:myelin-oligodendrocyte glycoprotein-like isoform 2-T3 [Acanthopagrus schlegelii]
MLTLIFTVVDEEPPPPFCQARNLTSESKVVRLHFVSSDQQQCVKVVVDEGSDAVLPCLISTKKNLTGQLFDWKKDGPKEKKDVFMYDAGKDDANRGQDEQFRGRVSHFQDQLMNGNASIKIQNVKVTDSGNYSCDFPHLQPSQTFSIELVVEKLCEDQTTRVAVGWLGGFILGAVVFAAVLVGLKATKRITLSCNRAPEPTATSADPTNDIPLLQVGVNGDHRHQNGSSKAPTETPPV